MRLNEDAFTVGQFDGYTFIPVTTAEELIGMGLDPADAKMRFYNPSIEGNWGEIGDISNPIEQDIKLVMHDKDGNIVEHLGEPIILSMMAGTDPNQDPADWKKEMKRRFTNKDGLSKSGVDAIVAKYNNLRQSIINGNKAPLKMRGITMGEWQEGDAPFAPVAGRAFPETKDLSTADLIIATTTDGSNSAEIVLNDGNVVKVKPGFTFLNLGDSVAPLQPRNLVESEANNVIRLLRKFETNVHTLINEQNIGAKAAYKQADTE